ncbi:ALF repeat-containing protein [Streptomyces hundungensis]|uniref:ALF repeat-containing protein n=1 Tax=Streptomyces hundungensis TaxID=1077946 RepID=UPI0033CD106B
MRSTPRAALLIAAAALAPALAVATPAVAAGTPALTSSTAAVSWTPTGATSEDDDRVAVARILGTAQQHGDRAVVREANKALDAGTPEVLRAFLDTGYRLAQAEDDSVATSRILGIAQQNGDRAVIREANRVLDIRTPEALRTFITTGYRIAQAEDDSVAISRILARPGISTALRAACNKALDGTPEDMRYFLVTGQYHVGD